MSEWEDLCTGRQAGFWLSNDDEELDNFYSAML